VLDPEIFVNKPWTSTISLALIRVQFKAITTVYSMHSTLSAWHSEVSILLENL
jgi:hypothetical protein